MWIYQKQLQHPVKIARPNPRLAGIIITESRSNCKISGVFFPFAENLLTFAWDLL